ncbi:MAG: hypothetical protein IJV14_06705 [Lachnospiraceae bacterium]|nr:hypothetical protein [Lachnospiraceae bacterium]
MQRNFTDIEGLQELHAPPAEFSPAPFWFFNDDPEETKVRDLLGQMHERGVDAFVLHPRIGVPKEIGYLSESFFEAVKRIVETAASLGMHVILYDEGMYPSGSAGGLIVKQHPHLASRGIRIAAPEEVLNEAKEPETIAVFPDGSRLIYELTGGNIRGIHFGEDDGEPFAPPSADILNPEAARYFLELTHEQYYAHLKEYFGNVIIGIFTDEPNPLGRNSDHYRPWFPGLDKILKETGAEIGSLRFLFEGQPSDQDKAALWTYRQQIKQHLREEYYQPIADWCREHGIALVGHPAESDDVEEEFAFGIPGQDLIAFRLTPYRGGLTEPDSVQAHLCADIASALGRRRNLNECFGDCNRDKIFWYFTGRDMKWFTNWLAIRGTNLFVPHAFFLGVGEKRGEDRPPDVGPHSIWWPYWDRISMYMKRLSWLNTDSVRGAQLAVLCDNNQVPGAEIRSLYERQVDFRYLPIGLAEHYRVENGCLYAGKERFTVILNLLGEEAEQKLTDALSANMIYSNKKEMPVIVSDLQEACSHVERTLITREEVPGLRAVRLQKNGVSMALFSNEGTEPVRTSIAIPVSDDPDLSGIIAADLWTGKTWVPAVRTSDAAGEEPGRILETELSLDPCETRLLILKSGPAEQAEDSGKDAENGWQDLTGRLCVTEQGHNYVLCSFESEDCPEQFSVRGEEMAECWCNGSFVDVSFYSPHRFCVKDFLREGKNTIVIRFTGNAANDHGAKIAFGPGTEDPWMPAR